MYVLPRENVGIRIHVKATFRNNFCFVRAACPSINAELWLIPDATKSGGFDVRWKRDGYPSMGVYRTLDGGLTFTTMAEDPEKSTKALTAWMALIGKRRQSIRMPPGCTLQ